MVGVTQARDGMAMKQRMRKLLGTVLTLIVLVAYSVGAGAIYAYFLEGAAWWVLILYFAAAGLLWFLPASWIIRWMARPD
jgi:hypothetical protein